MIRRQSQNITPCVLVLVTALAGIGFFNYHAMFDLLMLRFMYMLMIAVCCMYCAKNGFGHIKESPFPRLPWFIFICGLLGSALMAPFYHQQSLGESLVAQSTSIFAFLSFFVLIMLNPEPERLLKMFYYVCGVAIIVYFINVATFPHNMFGEPIMEDLSRGMLRLPIPCFNIMVLLIFYTIERWNRQHKAKYLVLIGVGIIMTFLSLTRQVILFVLVLSFFQFLQSVSWGKKLLLGFTLLVTGYVVITNLPIYKTMKDVTEEQIQSNDSEREDIRIRAWRYYAYEGHDDVETILFGNGTPAIGKSVWAKRLDATIEETKYYMADVSWAAMIYQYGLITTVAMLIIVIMAIFKRKAPGQQYLTYFMIYMLLSGIASGVWYFFYPIFNIMIGLYFIYRPHSGSEVKTDDAGPDDVEEYRERRRFITQ